MDDLFDIFINSVANQYDQRGTAGTARTTGTARSSISEVLQMYNILNRTLNNQINALDLLNAINTTDILDPFDDDFASPLEILRNINRTSIRGALDPLRDPFDVTRTPFDVTRTPFDRDQEDQEDDFALNRDLVDNLYAVRRYYESLARRPARTLSDFILDELNIEVDLTDLADLEDVKVTLTQDQFELLEKIPIGHNYEDKCNICLDDFCSENTLVKLNCKHIFHEPCIKTWLTTQSKKCPICRSEQ